MMDSSLGQRAKNGGFKEFVGLFSLYGTHIILDLATNAHRTGAYEVRIRLLQLDLTSVGLAEIERHSKRGAQRPKRSPVQVLRLKDTS